MSNIEQVRDIMKEWPLETATITTFMGIPMDEFSHAELVLLITLMFGEPNAAGGLRTADDYKNLSSDYTFDRCAKESSVLLGMKQ